MEPGLKRCVEMQERDAFYNLSTTLIFSFQAILRRCLLKSTVSVILLYFDFLVSHSTQPKSFLHMLSPKEIYAQEIG